MKIIKEKNFILRPYKKSDKVSLIKNINDKEIKKFTCRIPFPYGNKEAIEWIDRCNKEYNKKIPKEINFAIDIRKNVVGGIGLRDIKNNQAEIGYWLGKNYRSKGIITKAIDLIASFGFNELRLKKIIAYVIPENKASINVLEKSKFKKEGIVSGNEIKICKSEKIIVYSKCKA